MQSEEGKTSSEATKSLHQNKINPAAAKIEVVKVKKAKGGAIIVKCNKQSDAENLKTAIAARVPELRSKKGEKEQTIRYTAVGRGRRRTEELSNSWQRTRQSVRHTGPKSSWKKT